MNNNELPQWARDRFEAERQMGPLETNASPGTIAIGLLYIGLKLGIFIVFCTIIYMVGRVIVG